MENESNKDNNIINNETFEDEAISPFKMNEKRKMLQQKYEQYFKVNIE